MKYILLVFVILSNYSFAIDCKVASTKIETEICSNANLLELDREMTEVFKRIKSLSQYKNNIVRSQLSWLSERDRECNSRSDMASCLKIFTTSRIEDLRGKNSINGEDKYLVNIVGENYFNNELTVSRFSYPIFISPSTGGMKWFNQEMENVHKPKNDQIMRYTEPKDCVWNNADSTYSVLFRNTKYLEIVFYNASMGCGAAHPNHQSQHRHFDLIRTKPVSSGDILLPINLDKIYNKCLKYLADEQSIDLQEYELAFGQSIKRNIGEAENWAIFPDSATIIFDPYVAAPYASGSQTCELTKSDVRENLTDYMLGILSAKN